MKLIDENGRFQFIKNGQVTIDKTLLKYKNLKKIDTTPQIPQTVQTVGNTLTVTSDKKNVDEDLRQKLSELKDSNIKKYLLSEDAEEFNRLFTPILLGEVNINSYSTAVYSGNWDECVTPIEEHKIPKAEHETLFKTIKKYFKNKLLKKNKEKKAEADAISVLNFFNALHIECGKEKEFIDRISGYFNILRNAFLMHQEAQIDIISQRIVINIYESILAMNGFHKYIDFSEFKKIEVPGGKMVDIDYLKNFNRIIPQEVVDTKLKCDKMNVFDNYCVMYYDPDGLTFAKTAAARRDPILFGLINHSEKLYYICDWIDEYCDLTLDKIAETCNVGEIK